MKSVAALLGLVGANALNCNVDDNSKVDCGYSGINQDQCQAKNCCWVPSSSGGNVPWCFYPSQSPSKSCFSPSNSSTAPFTDQEIATFTGFFKANINIDGSGAVVAAPDHNTPGGDYYFHWERDGALSMRTLLDTQSFADVESYMKSYVNWVVKVQNQADNHGQDVRTEPKYTIPDGVPFTGAWCRPQTDGPGLRATALMDLAMVLIADGQTDYVKKYLWTGDGNNLHGGAVKYDLDWVAANWAQKGCDLWEEIESDDFFWNRFNFKYSMQKGAAFAAKMGDLDSAARYGKAAKDIIGTLPGHWTGTYLKETDSRPIDGAVIVGLNDGYSAEDGLYGPTSKEVAGTIQTLISTVCQQYPINEKDAADGVPGVLLGRYPGDHYAGGNPWILSSGALATLFYRAGIATLNSNATLLDTEAVQMWNQVFGLPPSHSHSQASLAQQFLQSGDGVLLRIRHHIQGNGFHMQEQIDKNSGVQMSAHDLTWSYAEVIKAVHTRAAYMALAASSSSSS